MLAELGKQEKGQGQRQHLPGCRVLVPTSGSGQSITISSLLVPRWLPPAGDGSSAMCGAGCGRRVAPAPGACAAAGCPMPAGTPGSCGPTGAPGALPSSIWRCSNATIAAARPGGATPAAVAAAPAGWGSAGCDSTPAGTAVCWRGGGAMDGVAWMAPAGPPSAPARLAGIEGCCCCSCAKAAPGPAAARIAAGAAELGSCSQKQSAGRV